LQLITFFITLFKIIIWKILTIYQCKYKIDFYNFYFNFICWFDLNSIYNQQELKQLTAILKLVLTSLVLPSCRNTNFEWSTCENALVLFHSAVIVKLLVVVGGGVIVVVVVRMLEESTDYVTIRLLSRS
jgi:hypothetical protein